MLFIYLQIEYVLPLRARHQLQEYFNNIYKSKKAH